jgi:glycopeptide antibiotics resistance protein
MGEKGVNTKKERMLSTFAWVMFIVYLLVLVRIVLFKDTQIYNLFAMIGHGQRVLNTNGAIYNFVNE